MTTRLLFALSWFVSSWPRWFLEAVASVGAWVLFSVVRYRREVLFENLATAFGELAEDERRRLAKRAVKHLALTFLEFFQLPRYVRADMDVVRIEGREHYEAAKAKGQGVLLLTGHFGSFEVGAAGGAFHLQPDTWCMVVKPFTAGFDRFVNELRSSAGLVPVHAKGSLRSVLRILRAGDSAVFVVDQNSTRSIGVFVDFFGKQACTMAGLAVIAQRTGAPVVPASQWREPDGTHVLRLHPEIPLEPQDDRDTTVRHMTQRYTEFIEARIREHPEQWLWTHRRWKTRP